MDHILDSARLQSNSTKLGAFTEAWRVNALVVYHLQAVDNFRTGLKVAAVLVSHSTPTMSTIGFSWRPYSTRRDATTDGFDDAQKFNQDVAFHQTRLNHGDGHLVDKAGSACGGRVFDAFSNPPGKRFVCE